jgi:N-acetylglucosaminyldiphosphoundecaprenol N-acetyl-beta-D-mannosaminyltransferase
MLSDSIVILGVPVDNLDMEETISRLFSMSGAYDQDGRPRLAVAVTAETIMRIRSALDNQAAQKTDAGRFPIITVETLRNADMMIPMGIPVAWASRILGIKLKKRISAVTFFETFLKSGIRAEKSIALLEASTSGPLYNCFFLTSPVDSESFPNETVHGQINSAGIDFLVIDIHDRSLAKWFEKSKNRIHVPVILLVPGSKEIRVAWSKISTDKKHPVIKQPGPTWKRSFNNFFKRLFRHYFELGLMVLPLVIYQKYNQAIFTIRHRPSTIPSVKSAFPKPARGMSVKIISMPDPLDASITEDIRFNIQKMSGVATKIILDFSNVNIMDSSGLGLLMGLCRVSSVENREIFFTGVKPKLHRFFKLTRTVDFFGDRIMDSIPEIFERIKTRISSSSFYYLALLRNNAVVYNFYGRLDAAELIDINTDAMLDPTAGKDIILNLSELTHIDNAGIRLIVKMHRLVSRNKCILIACGMRGRIRRLFSIVGIDVFLIMENDLHSAELALRRHHIKRFLLSGNTGRDEKTVGSRY